MIYDSLTKPLFKRKQNTFEFKPKDYVIRKQKREFFAKNPMHHDPDCQ